MLRVGVTIEQIEYKHLQNLLIFRVWIIWGCTTKIWGATAPSGYGPVFHYPEAFSFVNFTYLEKC